MVQIAATNSPTNLPLPAGVRPQGDLDSVLKSNNSKQLSRYKRFALTYHSFSVGSWPNEPVEKVSFLKTNSCADLKTRNSLLLSSVLTQSKNQKAPKGEKKVSLGGFVLAPSGNFLS